MKKFLCIIIYKTKYYWFQKSRCGLLLRSPRQTWFEKYLEKNLNISKFSFIYFLELVVLKRVDAGYSLGYLDNFEKLQGVLVKTGRLQNAKQDDCDSILTGHQQPRIHSFSVLYFLLFNGFLLYII